MGKGGGCVPSKKKAPRGADDAPLEPAGDSTPAPIPLPEEDARADEAPAATAREATSLSSVSGGAKLKIFIVFYSMYGHVEGLAKRLKRGVDGVEGVEGVLFRVPETLPEEVLNQMRAPQKDDTIPEIAAAELAAADGVLFGFPTRYGSMAAQMKAFFDSTGQLWKEQKLAGKPAGFFVSTGLKVEAKKLLLGQQSLNWHIMECFLFLLDIHLDLECSRWIPLEGVLHMVRECLPVMVQENQVKQSWLLLSIRASIWLL